MHRIRALLGCTADEGDWSVASVYKSDHNYDAGQRQLGDCRTMRIPLKCAAQVYLLLLLCCWLVGYYFQDLRYHSLLLTEWHTRKAHFYVDNTEILSSRIVRRIANQFNYRTL